MTSSTKSVIQHVIIAGLFVSTHSLPVCDMILKRGSPTLRARIGGRESSGFGLKRKTRELTGRTRSTSTLFSGKSDGSSKSKLGSLSRKSFILTGIFLLLPPIFLEAYSRIGTFMIPDETNTLKEDKQYSSFLPAPQHTDWAEIESLAVVFHGAGGQDAYTDELMKNLDSATKSNSNLKQSSYNHIVEWSDYSSNILQASFNGEKVGKLTAKKLLEQMTNPNNKLSTIHIIGISVGAFAADAAVNELKENFKVNSTRRQTKETGETPFVQLTLLDPFQQRGVFGVRYGENEFGKSADYAEQYLNTDDPVPSTNKPLKNAVCYDVTNLRPDDIFGHDWPLVYYARSDRCGRLRIRNQQPESSKGKTGSVIVL